MSELKLFEISKEEEAQLMDVEEVVIEQPKEEIKVPEIEQPKQDAPKETPEEETKPEVKEDVKQETEKLVPLSALNETRWELRQLKKQMAVVEEVKKLLESQKKPVDVAPDPALDPLGAQEHKLRQIETQQKELTEKTTETNQRIENQDFLIKVTQLENNFKSVTPDYDKAFNFLGEMGKSELQDLGIVDPEDVALKLQMRAVNISRMALSQGKNPAQVLYNMAKRYGYKGEEPKKETPSQDAVLKAAIKDTGKDALTTIEKGQKEASKTLAGAGETEIQATANALLNAEGEEFEKLWKQFFPEAD